MTKHAYLDTHVALKLVSRKSLALSKNAARIMESSQLLLSPAAELEMTFLHEIGRIKPTSEDIITRLRALIGLQICGLPFSDVVSASRSLIWTRDVFDRLIVGHAIANGEAPLVTFDMLIHQHYKRALS